MDVLNVIFGIITIIGTVVTCWQTYKAKKYKDEIKDFKTHYIVAELFH